MRELVLSSWQQANFLSILLWPLSLVYRVVFVINKALYARGIKAVYQAPVPVIVVGNLTVGGTGKTPMVIYLIEALRSLGYTPGVISRGYHSTAGSSAVTVKPDTPFVDSGDEPAMIVARTQVPMVISGNRRAACEMLLDKSPVDIIISDDGLQHHALARDVEICLLDETTLQRNHFLLPAGPYREPRTRLNSVDLVVVHKSASVEFNRVPDSSADQFFMHLQASAPCSLDARRANHFDIEKLTLAVAGIANPARFFDTCRSLGYTIEEHAFPDHHPFSDDDLTFGQSAQVLMTEKDAVKCVGLNNTNRWFLPVDAKLETGFINALTEKLRFKNSDK